MSVYKAPPNDLDFNKIQHKYRAFLLKGFNFETNKNTWSLE
jgi:hypothetical protein